MFTDNITDVYNPISVVSTVLNPKIYKNTNIHAGYAVVRNNDYFPLAVFSNEPDIISNEKLLEQIELLTGTKFKYAYYDTYNMYAYAKLAIYEDIEVYIEAINSYDGHKQRRVSYAFRYNDKFLFTNQRIMDWNNKELKWIVKPSFYEDIMEVLKSSRMLWQYYDLPVYQYPAKYRNLLPNDNAQLNSRLEYLKSFLPFINEWSRTSFIEAHKFATALYSKII